MDNQLSLIEIKRDYHEFRDGPFLCWWFNEAQFGYQLCDDNRGYLGSIIRADSTAFFYLDNAANQTVVIAKQVGRWDKISPSRCIEILKREIELLNGKKAQLTIF